MKENFDFGQFPNYFSLELLLLCYTEFTPLFLCRIFCIRCVSYKTTPPLQYCVTSSLRRMDFSVHYELPLDKGPVFIYMLMAGSLTKSQIPSGNLNLESWISNQISDFIWEWAPSDLCNPKRNVSSSTRCQPGAYKRHIKAGFVQRTVERDPMCLCNLLLQLCQWEER